MGNPSVWKWTGPGHVSLLFPLLLYYISSFAKKCCILKLTTIRSLKKHRPIDAEQKHLPEKIGNMFATLILIGKIFCIVHSQYRGSTERRNINNLHRVEIISNSSMANIMLLLFSYRNPRNTSNKCTSIAYGIPPDGVRK